MSLPLIILGILSVYLGNLSRDFFIGLGSQGLGNGVFIHPNHVIINDTEFGIPIYSKLLALILSSLFAIAAIYYLEKKSSFLLSINLSKIGINIYRFFNQRY